MNSTLFELNKVYQDEANQFIEARKRSRVIHSSGNIDASGDEIELPVREFLKRRLPNQYYISQGHIVDKELNLSSQLDIIVADNNATPILFQGQNGTEYIPYESVYLVGEVKSTYSKSKHYISNFTERYQSIKNNLQREQTPISYIGGGISLGKGLNLDVTVPYRNPLFSFMFFVDSGDIDEKHLRAEYSNLSDEYLPNIICFADGKVIVKANLIPTDEGLKVGSMDANSHSILSRNDLHWLYFDFTNENYNGGQALSILILQILSHLNTCVLKPPRIIEYMKLILAESAYIPKLVKYNSSKPETNR